MIKHIAALHPSFCNIFNIDIKAFVIYFYNQFPRPTHANGVLAKLTNYYYYYYSYYRYYYCPKGAPHPAYTDEEARNMIGTHPSASTDRP